MPGGVMASAISTPIRLLDTPLGHLWLMATINEATQNDSKKLWQRALSQYVYQSPLSDEEIESCPTPWVFPDPATMTIGVHAAVSGAPRDLYAAEEIAFEAVRSRMLAARVQGAWILTTYGSCAKLWSLANPSLSPEEVLIRAVFPRSNARGEPNSYFDLSDHCFEWEKIFGLLRLRRCLTPAFANRLFSDGLVDFVVDPSYATQISDLQYLRPDEDTITAMWLGGSRIVLPHVTVIRAVIWTGSEMKSCWSLTGPRFVPPQSGQYGWTRWQTSEVVRYWSWDHPRR